MSVIKVTLPPGEIPAEGKMVSFKAPCTCTVTDGIEIEGVTYTVCDALGKCVTGVGGVWDTGSVVTVVLSLEQKKAYVQNNAGYSPSNKPTAADCGAVSKTGDTMTGALNINSDAGAVSATIFTFEGNAQFRNSRDSNTFSTVVVPDGNTDNHPMFVKYKNGAVVTSGTILHTGNRDLVNKLFTATLSTSWTTSGSYFYQDIAVSGILATDTPIVGVNPGSDNAANVNYSIGFSNVFRITTSANSIRVWARQKPTVAIPIQIKVVR